MYANFKGRKDLKKKKPRPGFKVRRFTADINFINTYRVEEQVFLFIYTLREGLQNEL